jgi:hypothetical protein
LETNQLREKYGRVRGAIEALKAEMDERREDHIKRLIEMDNGETRGRIKELDYLASLPSALFAEINQFELSEKDSNDEGLPG